MHFPGLEVAGDASLSHRSLIKPSPLPFIINDSQKNEKKNSWLHHCLLQTAVFLYIDHVLSFEAFKYNKTSFLVQIKFISEDLTQLYYKYYFLIKTNLT